MSKETTYRELFRIQGLPHEVRRAVGINLSASHVNAVEIACVLFKAPRLVELLAAYDEHLANPEKSITTLTYQRVEDKVLEL